VTEGSGTAHVHIEDPQAHVDAVAADLEYFRRKRLESRVLHFARRGIVPLAALLRAHAAVAVPPASPGPDAGLERRIRSLEDRLDQLVHELAATTLPLATGDVVIEDNRKERGDYDAFFRLAPRRYEGALEERIAGLEATLDDCFAVVRTFTRALVELGEVTEDQLARRRAELAALGYQNGARIVARAWVDPDFKQRLLETGRAAVRELDIPPGRLGKLGVAENTTDTHHVVVCTLCSCYPHDLLGDPQWWYRTDEYKQRIVDDPRTMLADMFGLELPADTAVQVHDSTSDVRWMVLPRRPPGTEHLSEAELAELVTPESLVGAGEARAPAATPGGGPS
jgi:nitrile hydratase subunit alpha